MQLGASFNDTGNGQITGIENVTLTAAATLDLGQQTEAFTITGSSGVDTITGGTGADSISAGAGNDVINVTASNDTLLDGGADTDTLQVGANFTSSSDAQVANIENVTLTAAAILNLTNQTESFTITGSAGIDSITAGSGNDTIVGAQNDTLLAGGIGADTLQLGAGFNDTGDGQITGIENVTLTAAATLDLGAQTEAFTITGSSGVDTITGGTGADSISAGAGNDVIIVTASNDALLDGGTDTDTLQVGASFTSSGNGQVVNIENVTLTTAATLNLSNQTEGFTIIGSSGADTITGGSGADTITGGAGADRMTGGTGAATVDTFVIASGNSTPVTGGSGNAGTLVGYDVITDFNIAVDKLNLPGTATVAANGTVNNNNTDTNTLTILSDNVESHSVLNGIATFYGNDAATTVRTPTSLSEVAAVVQYLMINDIGAAGATLAFTATFGGIDHTYIYQQGGSSATNGTNTLVDLENVLLSNVGTNLSTVIGNGRIDPIVLDLDHNGISFSSIVDGVQFDINADGAQDQLAWTANGGDGILALDVNGSGKIESGNELFTPNFNGGHFADGIAALASLDGNHDGVIDNKDQAFGELVVWQDANHNGISEAGELAKLGDLGIKSIELATTAGAPIDGQNIAGVGSFTYADGAKGTFVEVDLDASLGTAPAQPSAQAAAANHSTQAAEVHDLPMTAAAAADIVVEFDHGDRDIDLNALLGAGAPAPQQLPSGEAHAPVLDAVSTPAAITLMHEQAQLAMQLAAH